MRIYFTRDSVHAGDDGDAPHPRHIEVPDGLSVEDVVRAVVAAARLPSISGGRATWCVASNVPLAVVAQQWAAPRGVTPFWPKWDRLDVRDGVVRMHFTYFAQLDPDAVHDVLRRLRLQAE